MHNDFSWCQGESPGTLDLVTGFTQPTNLPRIALKKHEMCPRSFIGRTRWGPAPADEFFWKTNCNLCFRNKPNSGGKNEHDHMTGGITIYYKDWRTGPAFTSVIRMHKVQSYSRPSFAVVFGIKPVLWDGLRARLPLGCRGPQTSSPLSVSTSTNRNTSRWRRL